MGYGVKCFFFNHILFLSICSLCLNEKERDRFLPFGVLTRISDDPRECSERRSEYVLKILLFRFKTINYFDSGSLTIFFSGTVDSKCY